VHICFISQEYPPETGWGGVGAYTFETAHALAGAGYQVTVISRAVGPESISHEGGVEVHRISPQPTWDNVHFFWRLNRIWPGFSWSAMWRARAVHRRRPIDIIEAAEVRADGFFVGLWPGRPKFVARLHTAQIFVDAFNSIPRHRVRRLNYWLEKQAIKRANLITAPSKAVLDLTRTWLRLEEKRTRIVPNSISSRHFVPGNGQRVERVLFVGRLERNKGAETILRALPLLLPEFPALDFLFVGSDGPDHDGVSWRTKILESLPPADRLRVRFETMSRAELAGAYGCAAVCILPSKWENAPYAALEAMACGTPVIACNNGGTPEIIEDGVHGFLVPVDDPPALAARISAVLTQPALRRRLGASARQRIEQTFSVERVLPKMLAAYEYAIAHG
jgi:glycogen(starch) synthase